MITARTFGTLSDGREVTVFKIENNCGEYVEIMDFGAVIHSINVKDRDGKLVDCVLGCADMDAVQGRSFKAATMGRVGNRIDSGRCVVDGEELILEQNRGGHLLHSGSANFASKLFEGTAWDNSKTVTLHLLDKGECGFNSDLDVNIHFTFDDDHRLTINYDMTPIGKATVVSPTNHAYFNLGGLEDIRDELLTLYASNQPALNERGVPGGGLKSIIGTPADFTSERRIGDAMESDLSYFPEGRVGYDDFYALDRKRDDKLAAVLYSPKTGIQMETYTDMQSVILFTPGGCAGRPDKKGDLTAQYSAVCLETQFVPNAVNVPEFDSPVFKAGENYNSTTVYAFSVR